MKRQHQICLESSMVVLCFTAVAQSATPPTVAAGYQVEAYVTGLDNPNALAFSPGGTFGFENQLFVGDSRPNTGTIYRIPSKDNKISFATAADDEPRSFEFGPVGTAFEGHLYVNHAFSIQRYDSSGTLSNFTGVNAFPWDLEFGSGGAFGTDLYYGRWMGASG